MGLRPVCPTRARSTSLQLAVQFKLSYFVQRFLEYAHSIALLTKAFKRPETFSVFWLKRRRTRCVFSINFTLKKSRFPLPESGSRSGFAGGWKNRFFQFLITLFPCPRQASHMRRGPKSAARAPPRRRHPAALPRESPQGRKQRGGEEDRASGNAAEGEAVHVARRGEKAVEKAFHALRRAQGLIALHEEAAAGSLHLPDAQAHRLALRPSRVLDSAHAACEA